MEKEKHEHTDGHNPSPEESQAIPFELVRR